jgi:hypothetical protein
LSQRFSQNTHVFEKVIRERFLNQTLKVFPANQSHIMQEAAAKRLFSLTKETFRVFTNDLRKRLLGHSA